MMSVVIHALTSFTVSLAMSPVAYGTWSPILPDDQAMPLLQKQRVVEDLVTMEAEGLTSAKLPITPWSDTYWPFMYGGAAWRYNHPGIPKSKDFSVNLKFFNENGPETIAPDHRSPAEKYDALVGDTSYALTRANWSYGASSLKQFGKVLEWEGFCHGWAPASFMEPEPQRSVTVRSVTGEMIKFTPSDIKALTTLIYATGAPAVDWVGTKCFEDKPSEDDIGRNVKSECLTTNPGTWHLAIVNRLGVLKESFILDITYSYAIWNQPVIGYRYSYFNPNTLETATSIAEAAIPVAEFPRDKFKSFRAPGTAFVVGIYMDLTYAKENSPSAAGRPEPQNSETVRYVYDLELDANRKIIGGEWYSKSHPDFIWAPKHGSHARSKGEREMGLEQVWNPSEELPAPLLEAAKLSSKHNQPVYGIVKGLLMLSNQPEAPTAEMVTP